MIYAYLRVSTDVQDLHSQKQGVDEFAEKNGWIIDEYIKDDGISGAKDPQKRKLGALLAKLNQGDKLIAAEISRLGRDLLMVMDILNHCMKVGCVVYTVKDNYTLGDDVQSKVLAFAFGLSAEIERKMIQARTKEGLQLRVKKGVLLGHPPIANAIETLAGQSKKEEIIMQYKLGVPLRRIAQNLNLSRASISFRLIDWGLITDPKIVANYQKRKQQDANRIALWKGYECDPIMLSEPELNRLTTLIEADLTIPEIHAKFAAYSYQQIYDTIRLNRELNLLYRKHGQKLLTSSHKKAKGYEHDSV